jgi:hypothetical protein
MNCSALVAPWSPGPGPGANSQGPGLLIIASVCGLLGLKVQPRLEGPCPVFIILFPRSGGNGDHSFLGINPSKGTIKFFFFFFFLCVIISLVELQI